MSERDLIGYGEFPPDPEWPGDAHLALQFVLAYETGGERSILYGDDRSEDVLTDIYGTTSVINGRNIMVESTFEYGSRVGVWRLLRLFAGHDIKVSALCVGAAVEKHPGLARSLVAVGHEIMSHGWRWIDYQPVPEEVEREHIRLAVEAITRTSGSRPLGTLTGRPSANTRRLNVKEGGFLYDQDYLGDELPHWVLVGDRPHLVLPYSYETNDNAFSARQGFVTGDEFFTYLREAFDFFYKEGQKSPRMMTVAVHDRLTGRPGRASGFERFLDYVASRRRVWICRGVDIARHWHSRHPYSKRSERTG
jgi:peptidoglycan/xylan/chitin deacetylase (PgdA/CDA1 family)